MWAQARIAWASALHLSYIFQLICLPGTWASKRTAYACQLLCLCVLLRCILLHVCLSNRKPHTYSHCKRCCKAANIAYTHYSYASYKSLMVTSSLSLSSYRPLGCVHTYLQIRILSRAIPESTARKRTQHPSERRKWQRHYQRQHTHTRSDDNENGKEFSSHSRVDRCTFDDVALVAWRAFNSEWDLTDFQVKGI